MKKIPENELFRLIAQLSGKIGLYIELLDTGERMEINSGHVFPSASIIKLPLLSLLLKDAQEHRIDLQLPHTVKEENRVGGTGIFRELDSSYSPTLFVLAKLMIVLSDNSATNEIIDVVGMERVNNFCTLQGYTHTRLMRKMLDLEAIRQGKNNFMSAGDAGRMAAAIARRQFINPQVSETIESFMAGQQYRNKLPAHLPAVPCYATRDEHENLKPDTVLVANKTGDLAGIQHDVGIFTLPDKRKYVISVFTENLKDDSQGIWVIGEISKAIYDAIKRTA